MAIVYLRWPPYPSLRELPYPSNSYASESMVTNATIGYPPPPGCGKRGETNRALVVRQWRLRDEKELVSGDLGLVC
jgi:hypothetical protein